MHLSVARGKNKEVALCGRVCNRYLLRRMLFVIMSARDLPLTVQPMLLSAGFGLLTARLARFAAVEAED